MVFEGPLLYSHMRTIRPYTGPVEPSKVKVKLPLCLIDLALCHEDIWGSGGIALPFLTSVLDGGEWSASCLGRFTPGEIAAHTHWIGVWVRLQSRSGRRREEKRLALPGIELRLSSP
jgi:hypothetical protein